MNLTIFLAKISQDIIFPSPQLEFDGAAVELVFGDIHKRNLSSHMNYPFIGILTSPLNKNEN
jgi:hypothetical protein